jgi:hypothetical protein
MRYFRAFLLVIALILMGNSDGCGGAFTPGNVVNGLQTAEALITSVNSFLKPSVDAAYALCGLLTKEDSPNRTEARFECAQITDAYDHVVTLTQTAQAAIDGKNQDEIDKATADLRDGIEKLKTVMGSSPNVVRAVAAGRAARAIR